MQSLTISLVPEARGGPFVFWDDLSRRVAQGGGAGLRRGRDFPPAPDARRIADMCARRCSTHNLKLAAVGTGGGWVMHKLHADQPRRRHSAEGRDFVRSIIDVAGAARCAGDHRLDAGPLGRRRSQQARSLDYLVEALNDLGEHARSTTCR